MRKIYLAVSMFSLFILFGVSVMGQGSITLESVDGLTAQGYLPTSQTITFRIRLTNNTGFNVEGWSCGHRIWSPDGAFWTNVSGSFTGAITTNMMENLFVSPTAGIDGWQADTIGFGGLVQSNPGIPTGFSEITHNITIGPVDVASNGLTICLDSSLFGAVTTWKWITGGGEVLPNWSGPYCYLVYACEGDPNDADNDSWADDCDNCPAIPNPDQANADGDEFGDSCDLCTDTDGDGFGDPGYPNNTCPLDNCPNIPNPGQEDSDQNGVGDICQTCCVGLTGNINCSDMESPDLSDLVALVHHLYVTFEDLCCMDEANVNGSAVKEPDISDLVYLVTYLFALGPEPVPCLTGGDG